MKELRINDPESIDPDVIAHHAGAGTRVVVQFSRKGYQHSQLETLNHLASRLGTNLEIRFFGHYSEGFNASLLRWLPEVRCLSLDCLRRAENLVEVSRLRNLAEFRLGVFDLDEPDVIAYCNSHQLRSLVLGDTRRSNIELAHIVRCRNLESFHTTGHTRNIDAICGLARLSNLSLSSIKRSNDLGFVSGVPSLKSLRVLLGGRESIAPLEAPGLESLEVIRVQGLLDVGEIGRFGSLRTFLLEDQLRIRKLALGPNPQLEDVKIINCKGLASITGLHGLDRLKQLRIFRTALDYDQFAALPMPRSLETLAFYTGKLRRDAEIQADLRGKGFREFDTGIRP
jgi:hypothetical protein